MTAGITPIAPIAADEVEAFWRAAHEPFGETPEADELAFETALTEADRTFAAREGGRMVAMGAAQSLDVSVPGGAAVGMAGVSLLGAVPTHRRRGLGRAVMRTLHQQARERGEPLAGLGASEGGISHHYGYGVGTRTAVVRLSSHIAWHPPPDDGDGPTGAWPTPNPTSALPATPHRTPMGRLKPTPRTAQAATATCTRGSPTGPCPPSARPHPPAGGAGAPNGMTTPKPSCASPWPGRPGNTLATTPPPTQPGCCKPGIRCGPRSPPPTGPSPAAHHSATSDRTHCSLWVPSPGMTRGRRRNLCSTAVRRAFRPLWRRLTLRQCCRLQARLRRPGATGSKGPVRRAGESRPG